MRRGKPRKGTRKKIFLYEAPFQAYLHSNTGQATLTVAYNIPPAITAQPQSEAVAAGYATTFSVIATAAPSPGYQWYFKGNPIPGANSSTYIIASSQPTNAGSYSVVVSNSAGSVPSDTAVLTVGFPYTFTTLAGNASPGSTDATGNAASFQGASGLAVDNAGNAYVADTGNNTIRKVTRAGVVTTLAGLAGNPGSADGTGSNARFNYPYGVAVDRTGNVYVADRLNSTVRKVTPAGVVTTLAGLAGNPGSSDGAGTAARFYNPRGVAVDGAGNVYVADFGNSTIRKVTSAGVVTTLAGLAGNPGSADKIGINARFNLPNGVAVDSAGNLYVADTDNHSIRKVTPAGVVTTLAGLAPTSGSTDGTGIDARFYYPRGTAVDSAGNVYVADSSNNTIRLGWPFPALQLSRSGNLVVLSWPASPATFGLEAANGLSATNWLPVSPQPVLIQGQNVVTNATSGGAKFYRLKLP